MMQKKLELYSLAQIKKLLIGAKKLPLALTLHYPSRGQTAVQELYLTKFGRLFLKKTSKRNHDDCRIDVASSTLAEREYWCYRLATEIGVRVPKLWLLDNQTTLQVWYDLPDAHLFTTAHGKMEFVSQNLFDCALFDWLTGQVDRHNANYLYDLSTKQIVLIDSAHSLLKHTGSLPDYLEKYEFADKPDLIKEQKTQVLEKINKLSSKKIKQLVKLNNNEETQALINRKKQLEKVNCIKDIIQLYRSGV